VFGALPLLLNFRVVLQELLYDWNGQLVVFLSSRSELGGEAEVLWTVILLFFECCSSFLNEAGAPSHVLLLILPLALVS